MARRKCLTKAQWLEFQSKEKICFFCEKAGLTPNPRFNPFEKNHIIPVSKGGTNDPSNLRWLCRYHNRAKRTRPDEGISFIGENSPRNFLLEGPDAVV